MSVIDLPPLRNLPSWSRVGTLGSYPSGFPDGSAGVLREKKPEAGDISSKEKREPSRPPQVPTSQECESIIQQLYDANTTQSQELSRVKMFLRDIVFNRRKFSPQMYSEAKAFLSDNISKDSVRFPKLSHKPLLKTQQSSQSSGRKKVILPAIRPTLNNLTERQKRAQDVHRIRLKK